MNYECVKDHCDKYMDKLLIRLEGCSDWYKVREGVFPFLNHLSVYFPEAYEHMVKNLEIENEND